MNSAGDIDATLVLFPTDGSDEKAVTMMVVTKNDGIADIKAAEVEATDVGVKRRVSFNIISL